MTRSTLSSSPAAPAACRRCARVSPPCCPTPAPPRATASAASAAAWPSRPRVATAEPLVTQAADRQRPTRYGWPSLTDGDHHAPRPASRQPARPRRLRRRRGHRHHRPAAGGQGAAGPAADGAAQAADRTGQCAGPAAPAGAAGPAVKPMRQSRPEVARMQSGGRYCLLPGLHPGYDRVRATKKVLRGIGGKSELTVREVGRLAVAKQTNSHALLSPCILLILPLSGQATRLSPV